MYSKNCRILSNSPTFRWITSSLETVCHRRMTTLPETTNIENVEDLKNHKRPLTDENIEVPAKLQKTDEVKRITTKKHVLMLCYCGREYQGMQRNPGVNTIEEEVLKALLKSNVISQENFENMQNMQFKRATRTDKGVSALRQIISLKMPLGRNMSEINEFLPNNIKMFGLKRVTKGFNAKNDSTGRTYTYILPTYAFAADDPTFFKNALAADLDEIDVELRLKYLSTVDGKPYAKFRLAPETLQKINVLTKRFEGTHNFHNFTSKVKPLDPRAARYITSFSCTETFISNDMEFMVLTIKGQSFLLHQIRKMVGFVIGVIRNIVTEDTFEKVFKMDRLHIPMAPSLGLCLNHIHYDRYNNKYGNTHETLEWHDCEEEVEKFYKEHILKDVIDTEISSESMLHWLAHPTIHRFALSYEGVGDNSADNPSPL